MKLIVCEDCEAEFQIKHIMDEHYYFMKFCSFCGGSIEEELKDEISWDEDE